ncbi:MAG: DUF4670 domain-containing protein, partial [Amoebophilaceae bacterium]|nr:DUF4670 domain-containing protein [Amoebophilaceae bacterium]
MPIYNHVILRSCIQLTTNSHEHSGIIQDKIHAVIEQRLMPMLEELFTQSIPHDVVIHLENLTIDGGTFTLKELMEDFPNKIKKAIAHALNSQVAQVINHPTAHNVTPLPIAKLKTLTHYLSEGHFAWWMAQSSEKDMEKLYLELLYDTPILIENLWYNLHKKNKAAQRFSKYFSKTTVEKTISLLLQEPIAYFRSTIQEVAAALYTTGLLKSIAYNPDEQLLAMALQGLISQQRFTKDKISFLTMVLHQVAIQNATSYEKVVCSLKHHYDYDQLPNVLLASQPPTHTRLLIDQLYDLIITPPDFKHKIIKDQTTFLKNLDGIGNVFTTFYQLEQTIHSIKSAMRNPAMVALLRSWLTEPKNQARLAQKLPDKLFVLLIATIDNSLASQYTALMQCLNSPALSIQIKEATLAYCTGKQANVSYYEQIKELASVKQLLAYPNDRLSSKAKERIATLLSPQPTDYPSLSEQIEQREQKEKLEQIAQKEQLEQLEQREQIEQIEQRKQKEQLEQIAQKEHLEQREQIEQIAQKEQLEQLAQKEQLEQIAQKEQLEQLAQKEQLEQIAQKEQLEQLAQKEQLEQIAQKEQ